MRAAGKQRQYLLQELSDFDGLSLPDAEGRAWWTFPIIVQSTFYDRDVLLAALLAEGIPAGVHFPRLMNLQPA